MKLLLMLFIIAVHAKAGSITVGPWYEFAFDGNHYPFVEGCQPFNFSFPCRMGIGSLNLDAPPWTFTAPQMMLLTITDAFFSGDTFTVFDFGVAVGSTPSVPRVTAECGLDPNVCLENPNLSHASFLLPPGPHSLTVSVEPVQLLGEGFLRLQLVPEPSNLGLVAALVFSTTLCTHYSAKRRSWRDHGRRSRGFPA